MAILTQMYEKLVVLREEAVERIYEVLRRIKVGKEGVVLVEYALLITGITLLAAFAIFSLYNAVTGRIENTTNLVESNP